MSCVMRNCKWAHTEYERLRMQVAVSLPKKQSN
jgi:hypothetical protein